MAALLIAVATTQAWRVDAAPSASGCSNISLPLPVRILDTRDVVTEPAGPNVGLLCGTRVLNVLMNNNQVTDPAAPDRGKYRFVNVRLTAATSSATTGTARTTTAPTRMSEPSAPSDLITID